MLIITCFTMQIKVEDVFDVPATLHLSQHCCTDHMVNLKRALVNVVRPCGLKNGDGCIIRLVLILCFVILAVKHLKLRKWISWRVIGKLRLLLMAFPIGKMRWESLRSTTPVMYTNTQLKSSYYTTNHKIYWSKFEYSTWEGETDESWVFA